MIPEPKLVQCIREGYSTTTLASDVIAGVTVGLVALPLAMAFAIASGVPPQNGIYCAIVAGFTPASTVWRQMSKVRGVMFEWWNEPVSVRIAR